MVKFSGASKKKIFNFLKIWMVSDKMIYRAFRIHKTLYIYAKSIRENISFDYLPKLYIGFKGPGSSRDF